MVYCTLCGFENDDDVEFCVKCGTPLELSQTKKDSDEKLFGSNRGVKESGYSGLTPLTFITGVIIGGVLILLGVGMALFFHNNGVQRYYGSPLLITLGFLILVGTICKKIRKKG